MNREPEILDAEEAATYLGAHVETVRRMARLGKIPAFKLGKDWRFRRDIILRWTEEKSNRNGGLVLIVDDDAAMCGKIRREIEHFGYTVRTASNGPKGLESVSDHRPDLILLDLVMPGMNGPEFLEKLRATCPELPVLIATNFPDSELMRKAMQYGPLTLIAKPIEMIQLERAVAMVLGEKLEQKR